MARRSSHEVIHFPSQYPDLQPIGTVRALMKGTVSRAYFGKMKLPDFLARLEKAFAKLQSHTIKVCINTANRNQTLLSFNNYPKEGFCVFVRNG